MAEFRFKPNEDFEFVVSQAVMGTVASRTRAARRHRVTLQQVGQLIIEEAQRLVDAELPGTVSGGRRNLGYDFRRREAGRTYRSSFRTRVELENRRLILVVENTHPHAGDVEFGNDPSGAPRTMRRKRGYYALPLSRTGYLRYLKNQNSPEAKRRRSAQSGVSYWSKQRAISERKLAKGQRALKFGPGSRAGAQDAQRRYLQRVAARQQLITKKQQAYAQLAGKPRQNAFAKVSSDGQPYLYTKTFRTYRGYAILRRATRSVTIRTLE